MEDIDILRKNKRDCILNHMPPATVTQQSIKIEEAEESLVSLFFVMVIDFTSLMRRHCRSTSCQSNFTPLIC